jgi:hypothetical protein
MPYTTINNKLLPFRQYDEQEVVNLYSLLGTGVAGTFVSVSTFNPEDTDGYGSNVIGADFAGTRNVRYNVNNNVIPCTSGDTKYEVLGVTLNDTREFDENNNLLIYNPQKAAEMNVVVSGQAVPVLSRGIVTLRSDAFNGVVAPGYVGIPDNNQDGKIIAVAPGSIVASGYADNRVVGRFLSSTGTKLGGYALFQIEV